jgi:hypothetical protein
LVLRSLTHSTVSKKGKDSVSQELSAFMSSPSGFLLNMLANKTLSFRDNTTTQTDIISKNNSLPIQYRTANQKKKKNLQKTKE